MKEKSSSKHSKLEDEIPFLYLMTTYIGFLVMLAFGHARDYFGKKFNSAKYRHLMEQNGYAPLTSDFESFYTRRLYKRIRDCWNRPTTGVPSRTITVLKRTSKDYNETFELSGEKMELINLSSYNYLGFSEAHGTCADSVEKCLEECGISVFSTRAENGNMGIHSELEQLVAKFVGREAAIISSMGFATNSTNIPAIIEKGCLLISDELNHSSIVFGSRLSGSTIRTFKHSDYGNLEQLLRREIAQGQPRTHRPWRKILVIIEGLYSMEGDIPDLVKLVELKKKYKFYLFVDEAHSIGALGGHGRGICDLRGVDPMEIDILMGTFTKSFGAAGGYIAGSISLINHLRATSHSHIYAEPMAPFVCQQIITSLKVIMGEAGKPGDGEKRLLSIYRNSFYFSKRLKEMGFLVLGESGSPVIPILIVHPCKLKMFSVECLKRGLAVVVVGYPATPIITSRARFCISAAHTTKDLDYALEQLDEIGDLLDLKMANSNRI